MQNYDNYSFQRNCALILNYGHICFEWKCAHECTTCGGQQRVLVRSCRAEVEAVSAVIQVQTGFLWRAVYVLTHLLQPLDVMFHRIIKV